MLPLNLLWRVVARGLSWRLAWWLLDAWWPFKLARRLRAKFRVWRAKRYKGSDEFHSSLAMDPIAMAEMTEKEIEEYLLDLVRRRNALHNRGL